MQLVLLLFLFLVPGIALANAGLPMLAVIWPLSAFAILPVICIESVVVSHVLKLPMRKVLVGMTIANVFSTLIGIPLAWVALVFLEILIGFSLDALGISGEALGNIQITVLTAPYLLPISGYGGSWVVPLATIVLLIPFFFASYKAEFWLVTKIFSPEDSEQAKKAIWKANLLSYLGLFLSCVSWLLLSLFAQ